MSADPPIEWVEAAAAWHISRCFLGSEEWLRAGCTQGRSSASNQDCCPRSSVETLSLNSESTKLFAQVVRESSFHQVMKRFMMVVLYLA